MFVAGLVGLAVIGVTAGPAWSQEEQPIEVPATSSATDRALEYLGYGVAITYRLGAVDTVVVRFRSGDPALATGQIVQAVWQHEPYRFARLDVEPVGGTSSSFTYDELATLLGPRPAGLDAGSLDAYEANVRSAGPVVELAEIVIRGLVILVGVVGGGLFLIGTCIALGGWAASKPRRLGPTTRLG